MKNINKWVSYWNNDPDRDFYRLIQEIQEDAYNQGIEDAAEAATASIESEWSGNTGSEYCDDTAVVNKQSILDLKLKRNETKSSSD